MLPIHDNNPTRTRPLVTIGLIIGCVVVFLWEFTLPLQEQARIIGSLGVTPAYLFNQQPQSDAHQIIPAWMTILTSMFLHGSWMHLLGNMLYLWIFGNNIEDSMGHFRFLIFYLACGVAAVFANAFADTNSLLPMIGASGAISGVLGAYLLLYPHAKVLIIVPLIFIFYSIWWPAWFVLLFWFIWQIASSILYAGSSGGGIAWGAHIGGFIAGLLLVSLFKHRHIKFFQG